jgi:hypothetical protein
MQDKSTEQITRSDTLSKQNVLLKTLLVREYMRRGVTEQPYTAYEMDSAAGQAAGWMIEPDGQGNYLAHVQS